LNRSAPGSSKLHLLERSPILELANRVARAGGRVVVVGGWVRDGLCGEPSNDFDLEIFGLPPEAITRLLRPLGFSDPVGRHFPVWRQTRHSMDVAYPRAGADLFSSDSADSLEAAFREAGRHRDLTVNAIGWDPLAARRGGSEDDALIDPWNGRADLEARLLRAVDPATFGSDPLRVLRVARLRARFDARVDPALLAACREIDLRGLPVERVATELRRILCESPSPSRAFGFLEEADQLDVFEPVARLRGVPQDPRWHPEGDVYVHTMMVVDHAAEMARSLPVEDCEILLFAALCHDLGKPETTSIEDGRIRSLGHEKHSADRTREWLDEIRLPGRHVRSIETLVANHLAPAQFVSQGAGPRAYRRLARKLEAGDVSMVDLERLARADHLGRATPEADDGDFEAGEAFLAAAEAAEVREGARPDVVSASHLIARGIDPGPLLGRLLARCREIQDETGLEDAEELVGRVLGEQ
jgi:tRNA nucleotidyltransferase (CCA-adding enzyme)